MDRIKQAAWYFISNPYKAENLSKEVEAEDKKNEVKPVSPVGKVQNKDTPIMELSDDGKGYLEEFLKARDLEAKWEEEPAVEEKEEEISE